MSGRPKPIVPTRRLLSLLAIALAAGITTIVIRVSLDHGRLSSAPRVDDVIYLARGAQLWQCFHEHGISGVLKNWRANPPHSPWSSGISAIAFTAARGVVEWVPYTLTCIPIAVFLFAAARAARRAGSRSLHRWPALALVVLASTAAFLSASAYNLKPDYCAGIFTAAAMLICLRGPVVIERGTDLQSQRFPRKRLFLTGTLFGLALLAKPAMLIPTVLLALGTLTLCLLRDALLARRWRIIPAFTCSAIVLLTMVLVASPHFVVAWQKALDYTHQVFAEEVGRSWKFHGTLWDHATYYLLGTGGRFMLDSWRSILPIGITFIAAGVATYRAHSARRRLYALTACAALAMAYLGPTIAPVKIAQFASAFSALVWLLAIHQAAWLFSRSRIRKAALRPSPVLAAALLIALAGSLATYRWTFPIPPAGSPAPLDRDKLTRDVYQSVRSAAQSTNSRATLVIATTRSDLFDPLFTLWSIRDHVALSSLWLAPPPRAKAGDLDGTFRAQAWQLDNADIVLCASGPTPLDWKPWSIDGWNEECRHQVAADPRFRLFSEFPPFSLYQRVPSQAR